MKPKKKSKFRIITKNKCYPLQDSVFYKLSSKRRLAKILFSSMEEIKSLCGDNNYRCFIDRSGPKPRDIQAPLSDLDRLHSRVASQLCRIETFDGLHSGRKGRSNISNAKAHLGADRRMITVDLKSFFPSTARSSVFDFFRQALKCEPDIADFLSRLLTFNDYVPTGSRVSMPLAYFANKRMFDEMGALAEGVGATMTIYVDDITFSGSKLQKNFIAKIARVAEKFGHKLHPTKTRFFGVSDVKLVTGTAIVGNKLVPRNKHLAELHQHMQIWHNATNKNQEKIIAQKVLGRINFMGGIDARYKDKARSFRRAAFK